MYLKSNTTILAYTAIQSVHFCHKILHIWTVWVRMAPNESVTHLESLCGCTEQFSVSSGLSRSRHLSKVLFRFPLHTLCCCSCPHVQHTSLSMVVCVMRDMEDDLMVHVKTGHGHMCSSGFSFSGAEHSPCVLCRRKKRNKFIVPRERCLMSWLCYLRELYKLCTFVYVDLFLNTCWGQTLTQHYSRASTENPCRLCLEWTFLTVINAPENTSHPRCTEDACGSVNTHLISIHIQLE